MRTHAIPLLLSLLCTACGPTIHGYTLRQPRHDESRRVAEVLDPLLMALELPSLRTIVASKGCKIGFAIVRTGRVNVWASPASSSPCLYFTLLLTEGALTIPPDHLMATIAHELGHLVLHHTPQFDGPALTVPAERWHAIQAQELEADRFAIALLKRTRISYRIGSCQALTQFLQRSVPDWYGTTISARMEQAIRQRAELADADCASADVPPRGATPAAAVP